MQTAIKNYITRARAGTYRLHLGSNQFVSITTGFAGVDIRRWYVYPVSKKLLPSKNGIALKLEDFKELCAQLSEFSEEIPDTDAIIPCQYTHADHTAALSCIFCTPSATF